MTSWHDDEVASGFPLLYRIPNSLGWRFARTLLSLPTEKQNSIIAIYSTEAPSLLGFGDVKPRNQKSIALIQDFAKHMIENVSWEDWGIRGLKTLASLRRSGNSSADFTQLPAAVLSRLDTLDSARSITLRPKIKSRLSDVFGVSWSVSRFGTEGAGRDSDIEFRIRLDFNVKSHQMAYYLKFGESKWVTYENLLGCPVAAWNFIEKGKDSEAAESLVEAIFRLSALYRTLQNERG